MGTGYTRNDTPNNIADGNVINASDLDGEFDAVQAAFNGSTGHSHDGTTGEGPQIDTAGLADGAVTSAKLANNIQIAGTLGVTGETTLTTHLNMGDNDIIKLGAGADLQIYHDASNSQIINSVGHLNIDNNGDDKQINLRSDDGSGGITNYIRVNGNTGAVQLYNYGSQKLATTSTGIDVTGNITFGDSHTIGNDVSDNLEIKPSTGENLLLKTGGTVIQMYNDSDVRYFRMDNNGDISFYEDTGTTPKFFWDASAESLNLKAGAELLVEETDSSNDAVRIASDVNEGFVQLYHDGSQTMQIRGNGNTYFNGGNVGIGTSSPAAQLHVSGTAPITRLTETDNLATATNARIDFYGSDARSGYVGTVGGNLSLLMQQAKPITFATSNTEAMRIDSSGNLLVGGTNVSPANGNVQGIALKTNNAQFSATANNAITLNRTDDGNIIKLKIAGGDIGSIGASGSNPFLANSSSRGISLGSNVVPCDSSGTKADAVSDLGIATGRFKDLYLSGGVYLGGTGSANKLDDYEEGTFSPTFVAETTNPTVAYSVQEGAYIKIGALVTVWVRLTLSSISGGSGNSNIANLPFAIKNSTTMQANSGGMLDQLSSDRKQISFQGSPNTTNIVIIVDGGDTGSHAGMSPAGFTASSDIRFQFSYLTDS